MLTHNYFNYFNGLKILRPLVGTLILAMALNPLASRPAAAQTATITVDGSRIVSPILQNAKTNYAASGGSATGVNIDVQVSGTEGGFEKLCAGTLDINMAVRGISDAELAACQGKSVQFVELLLGYNALVAAVNTNSKVVCVEPSQLVSVLSAVNPVTNWQQTSADLGDVPITKGYIVAKPDDPDAATRTLARTVLTLNGDLRTDLVADENPAVAINSAGADIGAFAVLSLQQYNEARVQTVKTVQVRNGTSCVDPTVPNLDEARYPLAQSLYLYVNAASVDRAEVKTFLDYLLSSDGRKAIRDAKFTEASQTIYDRGVNYVATKGVGRTFTRIQAVNIPAETVGTITLDGSPSAFTTFNQITTAFTPRFSQITVTATAFGDDEAYRKLCANTVDVVIGARQPTDAELTACQTNNVQVYRLPVGGTGVIILSNPADSITQCLKLDQLAKVFGADAPAKAWNEVDPAYAATPLTVIAPTEGKPETDFLMGKVKPGIVAPLSRTDTTQNDDPLYRAAGVRNVAGGITYLTYADYLKAIDAKIEMKPVGVDSGNGCIAPNVETIKNASYALSQNFVLALNVNSFARPEVKAYIWYLLGDDALSIITKAGIAGIDNAGFVSARDFALERFNPAPVVAAATPVPAVQATPTFAGPSLATPAN